MLSKEQAINIVNLLSNSKEPLESLFKSINSLKNFDEKLQFLTSISILMSDHLLNHSQQIVGIYFLLNSFKTNDPLESPFFPLFNYLFNLKETNFSSDCPPQLYYIINAYFNKEDLSKLNSLSASQVLSQEFELPYNYNSTRSNVLQSTEPPLSRVIWEKTERQDPKSPNLMSHEEILISLITDGAIFEDFDPPFMRPAPKVSPIFPEEFHNSIITSPDSPPFIFDENITFDSTEMAASLLQRASSVKLLQVESIALINEIPKNDQIIQQANLTFDNYISMAENNLEVAKEVFKHLISNQPDLLDNITCYDITQNLAQVILYLCNYIKPSLDFLTKFITENIKRLRGAKKKDLIPIFCNLIRNIYLIDGIPILTGYVFIDLDSFCVEVKTPEAMELRELLNKQ